MQNVYTDFGYGTFPGTLQWVGSPAGRDGELAGVRQPDHQRRSADRPLGIATTYKIVSSDSEATRKTKAYKWMIDKQIAVVMPGVKPTANSASTPLALTTGRSTWIT